MNNIAGLIIIFLSSVVGVYLYYIYAKKKSFLDIPNERSSHVKATPRGGGVVIAIIWFILITWLFLMRKIEYKLFLSLLCGLPVSAIGLVDDIKVTSPKTRLFVQLISASFALILMGGLNSVDIGYSQISGSFILSILAIIGLVWFTNLFNFLDGIDGYLSSEVIFIGLAFFLLYGISTPIMLSIVTFGFLIWNWQPAKIFMGDVGSTLMGFSIGVFAVYYQTTGVSSLIVWIMLTSVFWFDASLTLFRRWRNHEQLSKAHKKHAYQRIVQAGFSHSKTVLFAQIINLTLLALVLLAISFPIMLIPLLALNIIYLYIIMRIIDKRFPFSTT